MVSSRPGTMVTMERMAISEFKATCLAVLERVRRTGRPVLVTRRGEPVAEIVPPSPGAGTRSWLGIARGTASLADDLIEPAVDERHWDALAE